MSPPLRPQWHSAVLRSASHFPWPQLLISLLGVLICSLPLNLNHRTPSYPAARADRSRGIQGQRANAQGYSVQPPWQGAVGSCLPEESPVSLLSCRQGLSLLQPGCEQPQALRGSHLLPAAAVFKVLAWIVEVCNDQVYRTFLPPNLYLCWFPQGFYLASGRSTWWQGTHHRHESCHHAGDAAASHGCSRLAGYTSCLRNISWV